MGGARYTSSSLLCQVVETRERNSANHPPKKKKQLKKKPHPTMERSPRSRPEQPRNSAQLSEPVPKQLMRSPGQLGRALARPRHPLTPVLRG